MTRKLNLDDIQGNVMRAYGRFSFPFARYFFLNVSNPEEGRQFVDTVRQEVTTAQRWTKDTKPQCTLNIGFTFLGLNQLEIPWRTLQGMPAVYAEGMKARAIVLGDRDPTKAADDDQDWNTKWDDIWRRNRADKGKDSENVHIWISLNAQLRTMGTTDPVEALEDKTQWLRDLCQASKGGVRILSGIGRDDADFQSASAVFEDVEGAKFPTPKEHFGFTDGISDPVFVGQYPDDEMADKVIGRGKRMNQSWEPIATGEFLLGHPDESQELPPAAMPPEFSHNGTFMAFRKLHENVGTFHDVLNEEAVSYASEMDIPLAEAGDVLRAKMCGRWPDGVPLAVVPTYAKWQDFREEKRFCKEKYPKEASTNQRKYLTSPEASDFRYADDMKGVNCPGGAHVRRVNTRDYLDPMNTVSDPVTGEPASNDNATSQLNKRRRILRRGLPYGPHSFEDKSDETEQGVAMMIGASLFRQFEFVQQQWIQYGLDFHQGNNTCPMLGNHNHHRRHTIPSDPKSGKPPYVMSKLKTFVECRGGDYFFIPSMTALRMIAMGIVDPT